MRKLLGSGMVLLGGGLLWMRRMAERRRERDTLWEVILTLRRMGEEIRMARTPLPELLERLAKDCRTEAGDFFRGGGEALRRGESWMPAMEHLRLSEQAKKHLSAWAADLRGDEEMVCKVIYRTMQELEREGRELEERRPGEEKQLTAVCFSAAAMLVILLV